MKKNVFTLLVLLFSALSGTAHAETKKCHAMGFMLQAGSSIQLLDRNLEAHCNGAICSVADDGEKLSVKYSYGPNGSALEISDKVSGQSTTAIFDSKNSNQSIPTLLLSNSKGGLLGISNLQNITFGCDIN